VAKVTMPQLGESVAEGTIGKWLKKPGDSVAKYEPLLEVITDKVNAEVPSPFEGILTEILAEEGATVPNNAEIAVIEAAGEGTAAAAAAPAPSDGAAATDGAGAAPDTTPSAAPADAGASEKPAFASEPDTGGPDTPGGGAASGSGDEGHGPAGSDERPSGATATDDPAAPAAGSTAPPATGPTIGAAAGGAPSLTAAATAGGAATVTDGAGDGPGNPDARMTPAVRRLLREHGLTAAQIVGTGGGGRITRDDVTNYVESQRTGQPVNGQSATAPQGAPATQPEVAPQPLTAAASAPAPAATPAPASPAAASAATAAAPATSSAATGGTRIHFPAGADEVLVPMTQMRKGIAAQMTRALQAPHAYVQMEIDATRLVAFRERAKRDYQAREGLSLSFVPFVVKASAEALKRNPTFNAHWTEQGLLAKRRVNVGVAVAVDEGLIVPVVRDADALSIHGLNRAIADVAGRARANKLRLDDFGGGTFTVDNTGYLGTNLVMPILNVPEVGIVTMEAITKRPVVVSTPDGDVIAIRPVMNMVLGVDHRANDGAGGAALLRDIKAWLESVGPETPIY
jgi:2-oxoglutarate dehydrogenase E2 component (dihydrolipoamide succinyltransferase)